jgi:hypothetical protein
LAPRKSTVTTYSPNMAFDKSTQYRFLQASGRSRGLSRFRRFLVPAMLIFTFLIVHLSSQKTEQLQIAAAVLVEPHLKKSDLGLTLNQTDAETPSVRVTITNYHYSTTVSLLMWDSPFDPQAVATGMFRVVDRSTGKEVPSLGLKMSRLLSPKADDFVELLPRHAVTKDVPLEEPDIVLESGSSYDIQIRSNWKAVWHADVRDTGESQLQKIGGPTGLINWGYESNVFQLDVPNDDES